MPHGTIQIDRRNPYMSMKRINALTAAAAVLFSAAGGVPAGAWYPEAADDVAG